MIPPKGDLLSSILLVESNSTNRTFVFPTLMVIIGTFAGAGSERIRDTARRTQPVVTHILATHDPVTLNMNNRAHV